MKRLALILAVASLTISAAYALEIDLSGGGGLRASSINRILRNDDAGDITTESSTAGYLIPELFFDATYAEVDVGYALMLGGTAKYTYNGDTIAEDPITDRLAYLTLSLLGKYPFDVAGMKVFPLLGFEFHINTLLIDADGNNLKEGMTDEQLSDLNRGWIDLGVGADLRLSGKLFIRPKLLIGFAFLTRGDRDAVDVYEALGIASSVTRFKIDLGAYVGYDLKRGITFAEGSSRKKGK